MLQTHSQGLHTREENDITFLYLMLIHLFHSLALTCHEWEFEFLQRKVLLVKNAIYVTSII